MSNKISSHRRAFLFPLSRDCAARAGVVIVVTYFLIPNSSPFAADQDPSTIVVPYSSSSNRTLGDAVNIAFPYSPLGRCVSYQPADVNWDTGGAVSSDGNIAIATVEDEEKRTQNISLGYQTTGKIKAGIFDANSQFDTDLTTDSFRSDQSKTITIKFSASADYGRRMIEKYQQDASAPSPASDLSNFRQRCGTHFIRGERRASDLTILVRISASSQQGKDALTAHLQQTLGGGVSLKAISGQAGATFKGSYQSIIEFAKKAGNVSVDYKAHGGPGIAAAGAAAKIIDPSDFSKLSDITTNVSSLFTQDNSSITGYLLQSDTALGAPDITFDLGRVEQIGALTRKMMMLSEAASRYDAIKSKYPDTYTKYFQNYGDTVNLARSQLVQLINACAAGGSCAPPANDALQGLNFLEDMFSRADVSLSCQYQPASNILPTLSTPSVDPEVLESISINLMGVSHDPDLLDFSSTHIIKLSADDNIDDVTAQFSGFSLSQPDKNGEKRVFGTVYSENVKPVTAISYDNSDRKFTIDTSELQRRRDNILGSAFSIYAPGPNGFKVSYDVGFPPRDNCPPVRN